MKKAANRALAGVALVGMFSGSVATFTTASIGNPDDGSEVTGPEESLPPDTSLDVTVPADTTPVDTSPEDTAPADTTPEDTTPADTAPVDTAPEDTAPVDTSPEDTTPSSTVDGDGSVSGLTFIDLDGDGVRRSGEPAIVGQRVDLLCDGDDARFGTPDDVTATTTTDSNGFFEFTGLPAALCKVGVVGGVSNSAANTADPDGANDSLSLVTVDGVGASAAQTFGFSGTNSVGNRVYFDVNGNGVDNGAGVDPGAPNVTVTATWEGPDGTLGTGDDVVFTAVTNGVGSYEIIGLPDGSFAIDLAADSLPGGAIPSVDPDGGDADGRSVIELASGRSDETQDFGISGSTRIGDTVWLDLDRDGVRDSAEPGIVGATVGLVSSGADGQFGSADDFASTTTVDAQGFYLFDGLPAGTYIVGVVQLPTGVEPTSDPDGGFDSRSTLTLESGDINLDQDFGYSGTSGVGDTVFVDVDANGERDAGEEGVANVPLKVSSPGVDGVQGTADDLWTMTATDANGNYQATGLPSGPTVVSYDVDDLPDGFEALSDADAGDPFSTTANLIPGETNLDVDFAVGDGSTGPVTPETGGLAGLVFLDPNRNSRQDGSEKGVANVSVALLNSTNAVVARVSTDQNGVFAFGQLTPGVYWAVPDAKTLPSGTSIVTETDGTVDGRTAVTVVSGQTTPSGDFGIAKPATVTPKPKSPGLIPRTGSSGVGGLIQIGFSALMAGLGLMLIRRRPEDSMT